MTPQSNPAALAAVRGVKSVRSWGPLPAFLHIVKAGGVRYALAVLEFEQRRKSCSKH